VRIPRFPIGAVWHAAHADDLLRALSDPSGSPARLRSVSRGASRVQVQVGMTVTEARACCAELEVRPWDDAVIDRAVVTMTAALLAASPQVTPVRGAPGLWWVGATGFDETALVHALERITNGRIAIADSCVAARAATWSRTCIVPPGACAHYLSRAPLALIPMDEEVRAALLSLGLRTAGALAQLSASDVERRWGELGLAAWRLSRGDDTRRPILARPDVQRSVSVELPVPTVTVEPVLFLIRAALDTLVATLIADARTAAIVTLTLALDGPAPHTITRQTQLSRPVARVAPLLEQCRALLDRFVLSAPIVGVTVAITATAPAGGEQGDILAPTWRDPAAVDAALARLHAELGPTSVVRPTMCDDHRPEHAATWTDCTTASSPRPPESRVPSPESRCFATQRLLTAPEPVTVEYARNRPVAIHWRSRRLPLDLTHRPDRIAGAWWTTPYARDYWRCTSANTELLLFADHTHDARQWYVQGWYD
jgi:impB/mucB/samB family protein